MNQKELINQIEIITDKIIDKKYQKKYKDVIIQNYVKFLDNERKFTNKEKLLKVLKKSSGILTIIQIYFFLI